MGSDTLQLAFILNPDRFPSLHNVGRKSSTRDLICNKGSAYHYLPAIMLAEGFIRFAIAFKLALDRGDHDYALSLQRNLVTIELCHPALQTEEVTHGLQQVCLTHPLDLYFTLIPSPVLLALRPL